MKGPAEAYRDVLNRGDRNPEFVELDYKEVLKAVLEESSSPEEVTASTLEEDDEALEVAIAAMPPELRDRGRFKRKTVGKPHKTREAAERGVRSARAWGWACVRIEEKEHYLVVTGYDFGSDNPENKEGVSKPIQGRYRWPSK
jgi:hypothetical protein